MTCNSRGLPEPERMENMADDPAKVLPIMNDHEWQISHLVHAQIEIAHGDDQSITPCCSFACVIFAGALGSCPLPLARPSWPQGSQTHRPTITRQFGSRPSSTPSPSTPSAPSSSPFPPAPTTWSCSLPPPTPYIPQSSGLDHAFNNTNTLTPSVVGVGEVAGGFIEEGSVGADVLEGMKGSWYIVGLGVAWS